MNRGFQKVRLEPKSPRVVFQPFLGKGQDPQEDNQAKYWYHRDIFHPSIVDDFCRLALGCHTRTIIGGRWDSLFKFGADKFFEGTFADGGESYFVANIKSEILSQYIDEKIRRLPD